MVCRGARGSGGRRHDNEVAKGSWDRSLARKGKESVHADELGACVSSGAGVRACVRVRPRARQRGGGGTAEYYGLSVAR